jgi:hypothetical protein
LAYLGSLPVRGEILVGVRFAAAAIFAASVAPVLAVVGHILFPAVPLAVALRVAAGACLFATFGAWILIAPLTRYEWSTVVTGMFVGLFAVAVVFDRTGLSDRISAFVGERFQAGDVGSVVVLGLTISAIAGCIAVVGAFAYATKKMQPHGGIPSSRARAVLKARGQLRDG